MRILDYYRQFADPDPDDARRRAQERRAAQIVRLSAEPLDLSSTEWIRPPHPDIVQAVVHAARGRLQQHPDPNAQALRRRIAELRGVELEQVVVGNGAAELLAAAAGSLLGPGDELLSPWPSYALLPSLAARSRAAFTTAPLAEGRIDPGAVLRAVTGRTRVVILCNPNDPTGTYLGSAGLANVLENLSGEITVIVDEALVDLQQVEHPNASIRLTEQFPRLLLVRSFSKAYGLAGLRVGYAIGSARIADALPALGPVLGTSTLAQAAARASLDLEAEPERSRLRLAELRTQLQKGLDDLAIDHVPSETHFVWLRPTTMSADSLVRALGRRFIYVYRGTAHGEPDHIRVTMRSRQANTRLLEALTEILGQEGEQ